MPFLYFIVLFCFNCFTQPSRFRVPGRIVWDQPADRLVVEALEGGSHQLVDRANVSPDGQFELIVTSESVTYEIRVLTLHGETVKSDYINVRAHVPIEIRLPSARARPNPAGPISARHLMHKPLKAAQKLPTRPGSPWRNRAKRFRRRSNYWRKRALYCPWPTFPRRICSAARSSGRLARPA